MQPQATLERDQCLASCREDNEPEIADKATCYGQEEEEFYENQQNSQYMEDMFSDENWEWDNEYNKIENFKNDSLIDIPDQLYSPHKMQDFPFNNNFD